VLIKNKLSEVTSQLVSLIKYVPRYYGQRLEEITHICEVENKLAKVSNMDFVFAIRPVLRELSYMEIEPFSVVYKDYIEKVKLDILDGKELVDVLNIYDRKLFEMKGGKDDIHKLFC